MINDAILLVGIDTCMWCTRSGSIGSSNIQEPNRNVTVIQGANDSRPISFTCNVQPYPSSKIKVKWTRESKAIQPCSSTRTQLEDGKFCTEDTFTKSVLRFGKILKGISDGNYKCEQWRVKNNQWKERRRHAEYVSITINDLTNFTGFTAS